MKFCDKIEFKVGPSPKGGEYDRLYVTFFDGRNELRIEQELFSDEFTKEQARAECIRLLKTMMAKSEGL